MRMLTTASKTSAVPDRVTGLVTLRADKRAPHRDRWQVPAVHRTGLRTLHRNSADRGDTLAVDLKPQAGDRRELGQRVHHLPATQLRYGPAPAAVLRPGPIGMTPGMDDDQEDVPCSQQPEPVRRLPSWEAPATSDATLPLLSAAVPTRQSAANACLQDSGGENDGHDLLHQAGVGPGGRLSRRPGLGC